MVRTKCLCVADCVTSTAASLSHSVWQSHECSISLTLIDYRLLRHSIRGVFIRDVLNVRLWHSAAKAEGVGSLTERVLNIRPSFGRMLYDRMNQLMSFIGECTEWPGNVLVSKYMSTHASSEMGNYIQTAKWYKVTLALRFSTCGPSRSGSLQTFKILHSYRPALELSSSRCQSKQMSVEAPQTLC